MTTFILSGDYITWEKEAAVRDAIRSHGDRARSYAGAAAERAIAAAAHGLTLRIVEATMDRQRLARRQVLRRGIVVLAKIDRGRAIVEVRIDGVLASTARCCHRRIWQRDNQQTQLDQARPGV